MNRQENITVNDHVRATRNTGDVIEGTVVRVSGADIIIATAGGDNLLVKWTSLVSIQKI